MYINHLCCNITDVGGQHCPCPVFVSFLSGFSENRVWCLPAVRIFCPVSACLDSVSCHDSVWTLRRNTVRCLSVRPDKDETELSELSLSLSTNALFFTNDLFAYDSENFPNLMTWTYNFSCQTSADKDSESSDNSISSLSGRTDRHRTVFLLNVKTESRQTDTGQKIRTADRHQKRFSGQ